MAGATARLGLYLPGGGSSGLYGNDEQFDVDHDNDNMKRIDAQIGFPGTLSTARPSSPFDGQIIYETDTRDYRRYNNAASNWDLVTGGGLVPLQPASATGGTIGADGAVTLSGASSIVLLQGLFAPAFDEYLFKFQLWGTDAIELYARLTSGVTPDVSANYVYSGVTQIAAAAPAVWAATTTQFDIGPLGGSADANLVGELRVTAPTAATKRTRLAWNDATVYSAGLRTIVASGVLNPAAAHDGLQLFSANGSNISGIVQAFGYSRG